MIQVTYGPCHAKTCFQTYADSTVWSELSVSTNRIIGYYRMNEWRAKAWVRPCACWICAFCACSKALFHSMQPIIFMTIQSFLFHYANSEGTDQPGQNHCHNTIKPSLAELNMPCLSKPCRSRSVGFFRSKLIWICSLPSSMWICINNLDQVIWLAGN